MTEARKYHYETAPDRIGGGGIVRNGDFLVEANDAKQRLAFVWCKLGEKVPVARR
jgi:hypothetical protein